MFFVKVAKQSMIINKRYITSQKLVQIPALILQNFRMKMMGYNIEVTNPKGNPLIKIYELSKWQDMLTLVMWCWTVMPLP